ncbi:hypothetical protein LCGC14_1130080 [marine sediment metagenome]|uniref:Uncharacterized protein n=1 Tax=marine sediment metagenome TaxID=412755 RepID=A0A0F9MP56_9ZZZZ
MPIRRQGESTEEARKREVGRREAAPREERRVAPPERTPTPAGQEFGQQPVPEGERLKALHRKVEQRPLPEPVPNFDFEWWAPKAPVSPLAGEGVDAATLQTAAFKGEALPKPEFDPIEAVTTEFSQFVEWNESLFDNISGLPPDPIAGASEILDMSPRVPLTGQQGRILDASWNMFLVYKNLEEYLRQYTEFDPDTVKELSKQGSMQGQIHAGTLNPIKAFWDALDKIHDEHPDSSTGFLATDAGRAELFSNALLRMFSTPTPEWSGLNIGQPAAAAVEGLMPDVPILKEAIKNTLEIAGDPLAIGATVLFPPAGFAAKTKLGAAVFTSMGVGEEVAEEVGVPGVVGALVGGVMGPSVVGLTRAAIRSSLRNSRHFPVRGEPATEMQIAADIIPGDFRTLRRLSGESPGPPGTVLQEAKLSPAETGQGRHTVQALDESGVEIGKLQWREPPSGAPESTATAHVSDVVVQTERQGVGTALMQDLADEAAVRGLSRITGDLNSEAGIRLFGRFGAKFEDLKGKTLSQDKAITALAEGKGITGEITVPKLPETVVAGGSTGPSLEEFNRRIFANLERPEARDILRLASEKMAETVPLGLGKRLMEMTNRGAVASSPEIKAALGWHYQQFADDAARFMAFSKLRGKWGGRNYGPLVGNDVGQIWIPKLAGTGKRTPGNLFRRGEGEWIAMGDVFESILRGENKYLSRVTTEQTGFVKELDDLMRPFIQDAERITGMKIAKRETWFPRLAQDPETKAWKVGGGTGKKKPSSLMARQFEEQQVSITQAGNKYVPGAINISENTVKSFQSMTRDALMGQHMKEAGILKFGKPKFGGGETYATDISATLPIKGVVTKAHAREINTIIGPRSANPAIVVPEKINQILRMALTGSMDAGWGAIQLATLPASPAGISAWVKAMARGMYNAAIEPKQIYRFLAQSKDAQRYALYGGDVGFSAEVFDAARVGGVGLPRIPKVSPIIDVATFPARTFINRLMVGMDSALLYGRVYAHGAYVEAATKPGLLLRAQGIKPLAGKALHEEMYRITRFTDTLIGQPKMGGTITATQHQLESGWLWFATRYTRSFWGTMSYVFGKGYTPAQARVTLAKLLLGGIATMSGLIMAKGKLTNQSAEQIQNEIQTSLDPTSGKKFLSMKIGKDWYGMGGTYRSGFAFIAGTADKENWNFENWEEGLQDNPFSVMLRGKTTPLTGTFVDFVEGEDFLGYAVNKDEFVDDPRKILDYAIDNFAPITTDALLQEGDVLRKTPRFIAEFFGLRTSPETAWEALNPVMNQVSLYKFGVPYEELEHNLPARDFVRNHPNVLAVTKGDVRPIRERERDKFWRKYREGRDGIRDTHIPVREDIEEAYTSGRMDGSDYREQYGESQSAEYFELKGFRQGLDVDFDSGDEGDAPAGSVDAALGAYYEIDLDDYRDKDTRVPDWEAFFADRDAALAQVPEEFEEMVGQWLHRRETEVRRHMRARFEEVVEPSRYFRMREDVAVSLEINLDDLESEIVQQLQAEDRRATPADVSRLVDKILNGSLDMLVGEDAPNISDLRNLMREITPKLDAELFRQGFTSTVRSEEAQGYLRNYMQSLPDMGYFEAPLAQDVKERLEEERGE